MPASAQPPSQVRHWLGQLGELVDHMDREGWDAWARDRARAVIEFFAGATREQRRDEEQNLFPAVSGHADASLAAQVEHLQQDHGWLDENWTELASQLRPIAEGFGGYDVDILRHATGVYASLWNEHLDLVERVLRPAAARAAAAPTGADAPFAAAA